MTLIHQQPVLAIPAMGQLAVGLAVALMPGPAAAEDGAPLDYGKSSNWICGPDAVGGPCADPLSLLVSGHDGQATIQPIDMTSEKPIDCFYVYPTISMDQGVYADHELDGEIDVVRDQLTPFGGHCRLIAPFYRQVTVEGLSVAFDLGTGVAPSPEEREKVARFAYGDVLGAWRYYMAHYNHGRAVVLVAHSQGSMHMKRLIAEEIDGKPVQDQLVAAYLAGNSDLDADSFSQIPQCRSADQTGCLVAWSSYRDADVEGPRVMGGVALGRKPVCANPAVLDGNHGQLISYCPITPDATSRSPRFVRYTGQMTAQCLTDDRGGVLSAHVFSGTDAKKAADRILNQWGELMPGWGYHDLDMALVQGNLVNLAGMQGAAWLAKHGVGKGGGEGANAKGVGAR